jgi:hypothetical protein
MLAGTMQLYPSLVAQYTLGIRRIGISNSCKYELEITVAILRLHFFCNFSVVPEFYMISHLFPYYAANVLALHFPCTLIPLFWASNQL